MQLHPDQISQQPFFPIFQPYLPTITKLVTMSKHGTFKPNIKYYGLKTHVSNPIYLETSCLHLKTQIGNDHG